MTAAVLTVKLMLLLVTWSAEDPETSPTLVSSGIFSFDDGSR